MSGTLWKEPREFRCLKGAWDNPVTANTPEDAGFSSGARLVRSFQVNVKDWGIRTWMGN